MYWRHGLRCDCGPVLYTVLASPNHPISSKAPFTPAMRITGVSSMTSPCLVYSAICAHFLPCLNDHIPLVLKGSVKCHLCLNALSLGQEPSLWAPTESQAYLQCKTDFLLVFSMKRWASQRHRPSCFLLNFRDLAEFLASRRYSGMLVKWHELPEPWP